MRKITFYLFLIFFTSVFPILSFGQAISILYSDSTIVINESWKFHAGDDPQWANPDFDDDQWQIVNTTLNIDSIPVGTFEGLGWFRLQVNIDSGFVNKPLALIMKHDGASEVYVDGRLFKSFGKPGNKEEEQNYDPRNYPEAIVFNESGPHVFAVKYSNHSAFKYREMLQKGDPGFVMEIAGMELITSIRDEQTSVTFVLLFLFGFLIALSFLHLVLFLFYKAQKSNLYYSLFTFIFAVIFLLLDFMLLSTDPDFFYWVSFITKQLTVIFFIALLALVYSLYNSSLPKKFWIFMGMLAISYLLLFTNNAKIGIILLSAVVIIGLVESIRVIITAIIRKKEGAWIIGSGIVLFILSVGIGTAYSILFGGIHVSSLFPIFLLFICLLSIPLSMSVYLAWIFARTNKNLTQQLVQVQLLSDKSMEQEKEKQKILETQKEKLELQVKERTAEVVKQKEEIESKSKDITDSITYAKRIQDSILPSKEHIRKILPESFVFYQPKDIVSGDFYWFAYIAEKGEVLFAAVDCTGHGVPGAFMSMVGNDKLNQIILENGVTQPAEILNQLNKGVKTVLKQNDETATRDGMDIALINIKLPFGSNQGKVETQKTQLSYAGAHRPLYLISNGELRELIADKMAIGGSTDENYSFQNHTLTVQKEDTVYVFSDGFADQFGGEKGKKFMTKNFKKLLLSIQDKPMQEQEHILKETLESWKGSKEQVDDILVIGIRL